MSGEPSGEIWVRLPRYIGDAMMIAQSLQTLRNRSANLVAWGPEPVVDLFRGSNYFSGTCAEDPLRNGAFQLAKLLRSRRARAVLGFSRSHRSLMAAWLARVPIRLGWREGGGWILATRSLPFKAAGHQVDRYRALLEAGFPGGGAVEPGPFRPREEARQEASRLLPALGIRRPCAIIAIGAAADHKRVATPVWADLAARLEALGLDVLFLGGPFSRDQVQAEELRRSLPQARILCGDTTLAVSAALLEAASLCFCNDSAMAHVAAACHRPTVVLFGPTDPLRTAPTGPKVTVVRLESLDCLACNSFVCRRGDLACMKSPELALRCVAAARLLQPPLN
jgi:ADP-heptose:LPS heptosyltransferase